MQLMRKERKKGRKEGRKEEKQIIIPFSAVGHDSGRYPQYRPEKA